jgi:hypothetical protein
MPWQVATRLQKARDRSAADTVRIDAGRNWHSTSTRVQAARLRLGSRDCDGSQASLNSDCQKTGESNFSSPTTRHIACNVVVNAFQQYERLVNLATAKLERRWPKFWLAHPPPGENGANSLEIHDRCLLKSSASRQEKASACNRNCAATDEHFRHYVVFDRCTDVNAAGSQHLNSLLDDNGLTACRGTVTHEVGDGAT